MEEAVNRDIEPDEATAVDQTRAVLEQASRLYAKFSCPSTAQCCQLAVTTRPPWLWRTEWLVLKEAVGQVPPPRIEGGCRLLDASGRRCTVYDARPFGCRTFFCEKRLGPAHEPTARTHGLLEELTGINIALDASASPRPLDDWLSQLKGPSPAP